VAIPSESKAESKSESESKAESKSESESGKRSNGDVSVKMTGTLRRRRGSDVSPSRPSHVRTSWCYIQPLQPQTKKNDEKPQGSWKIE
jgi:hypothetical protein